MQSSQAANAKCCAHNHLNTTPPKSAGESFTGGCTPSSSNKRPQCEEGRCRRAGKVPPARGRALPVYSNVLRTAQGGRPARRKPAIVAQPTESQVDADLCELKRRGSFVFDFFAVRSGK